MKLRNFINCTLLQWSAVLGPERLWREFSILMEENKSAQFFPVNGLVLSFAVVFATFFLIEKTGTFMSSINSLPDGRLEMKKGLRNQSTKDQGI